MATHQPPEALCRHPSWPFDGGVDDALLQFGHLAHPFGTGLELGVFTIEVEYPGQFGTQRLVAHQDVECRTLHHAAHRRIFEGLGQSEAILRLAKAHIRGRVAWTQDQS